jgi:serine/threonine protein phosphatase 1
MSEEKHIKQHQFFTLNSKGTDFFVGDIHGEYDLLMKSLERVHFNFGCDRLFATGDLIDRGPQSAKCLKLLDTPWFHSVLGNHEALLITRDSDPDNLRLHLRNGGSWADNLTDTERSILLELIYGHMTLSMTIEYKEGSIGVIHAMSPNDWGELDQTINDWIPYLWSTQKYQLALRKNSKAITNVNAVVHGHVGCNYIEMGSNQLWIDTLMSSGRLTLITASQVFSKISMK